MFLSPADLVTLTGLTRYSAQCRWLTEHGYRHERDVQGRPVVLRSEVERRLSTAAKPAREPSLRVAGL
jgi:hypothetical protein